MKVSRKKQKAKSKPLEEPSKITATEFTRKRSFPVVGVGASAGGFEAFSDLLRHLPQQTGMAFVLVQHLDPTHGSALPEMLARITKIPVVEVTDGVVVKTDHVYVMPPNTNMILENGTLHLSARIVTRGQHLPVDYFFHSLARERDNQAIGVILSGTASDGTDGCQAIKAAGGITFAQDEVSAKFSSMPRSAMTAGCIDFVLEPRKIAQELARIGRHPYLNQLRTRMEESALAVQSNDLNQLLRMLRDATGVDFGLYKQTTLQRRIKRRMVLHRVENLKDYFEYIKGHPGELDELYRDILIHVTGFFRDNAAFDALRRTVFPALFRDRKLNESPIRIWVPGCSTGEEVYSIAIVLLEYMWEEIRNVPLASVTTKAVQVFGTDISDSALDRARSGLYTEAAASEVSAERLKRFFVKLDGGYQINKSIREMCIFANQNVAKDPPFSNVDLVSCRNLLIYLSPALQKRVIPTLHYALKPNGYLMLGGSESLGTFSDHFILVDKKQKIYQKKRTGTRIITYFTGTDYGVRKSDGSKPAKPAQNGFAVEKGVERLLANRFAPASIVVNDEMEIVQFRGRTGAYLEPAAGHPTFSLSKMAREGLLVDLRAALNKAKKENAPVRREGVHVKADDYVKEVNLEVIPVRGQTARDRFYVVVFQDAEPQASSSPRAKKQIAGKKPTAHRTATTRETERLQREAAQLRDQLQSLIEDHESTAEEYKSANEELQSTNEELETAKEELQSSNEELTTLNEELQNRNVELSLANNDLINLLGNVNIPVVIVGNDLRIRRFTPPAQKLLNLIPADINRRLGEIRPNLNIENLEELARETIDSTILHEEEVQEKNGGWHVLRIRPYKTWDNKIDGAVISFQDIDLLKRNLDQTRNYADTLIKSAREAILLLDPNLRVTVANPAFYRHFRVLQEETDGRLIYDLGNRQWNIPRLRELLEEMSRNNTRVDDFEVTHDFPQLGKRTMLLNGRRIEPHPGQQMIFLAIDDVTEQRKHMESLARQAALLELAHDTVMVRDLEGQIQFWNHGAEVLYGWKKDEAIGRTTQELLKTEFPEPFQKIKAALVKTGHWEGELVHTRRNGEKCTVDSRWALQLTGRDSYVILEINSDITQRKTSEESLRQLSGYLMRVQDEERRRIARELHDSTGQKLVALKMNLSLPGEQTNGKAQSRTAENIALVDEALAEIRSLAQLLHPPLLDEAGLISATKWLTEGFGQRAGIEIELNFESEIARLPESVELALFRVIQESLNNIHRHSGAQKARIELRRDEDKIILEIRDDGKGLPVEMVNGTSRSKPVLGVGVLGMKERLIQLGGTLEIQSGKKGTIVRALLPLPAEEKH